MKQENEDTGLGKPLFSDGTKLSGFVTATKNRPPRQCDHCIWYSDDHCHHPIVKIDPDVPGDSGEPKPVGDLDCCNFFRPSEQALVYMVRHGDTVLNDEGAFRGWMDVDLTDKGRKQAEKAGKFLKDKGIKAILCSPLKRAVETAQIIANQIGLNPDEVCEIRGFLPWHVGQLSGQSKEANKDVLKYALDNPEWVIPEGESILEFGNRFRESFDWVIKEARNEDGPVVVVFHTSNIIQAEHYIGGEDIESRPEEVDSVNPGGIVQVTEEFSKGSDEGTLKSTPVFGIVGDGKYGS